MAVESCPQCHGDKIIMVVEGRILKRTSCPRCHGHGTIVKEPPPQSKPQCLDPLIPYDCSSCSMDINRETDAYCWSCGMVVGEQKLRRHLKCHEHSTCRNCGSSTASRLTRWGIFLWLPAWHWPWPIRRLVSPSFCHVCGEDLRSIMIC